MNNKRFLISGVGRCGTHYVHKFLNNLGVCVTLERQFNLNSQNMHFHSSSSYRNHSEVSWYAGPHMSRMAQTGISTITLLRDPLAILNSMIHHEKHRAQKTNPNPALYLHGTYDWWFNYCIPQAELAGSGKEFIDAMRIILHWNTICMQSSRVSVRVEDLQWDNEIGQGTTRSLMQLLEIDATDEILQRAYNAIPFGNRHNRLPDAPEKPAFTWISLEIACRQTVDPTRAMALFNPFKGMAIKLGYGPSSGLTLPDFNYPQ